MLFHGSRTYDLKPGQVIEPRSKKYAHATRQLHTARVFGSTVYEVEPVADDLIERRMKYDNDEGHFEVISESGFRVIRVVPDDEYDPEDEIGNYLRRHGYLNVEEWAEDSGYEFHDDQWWDEENNLPVNILECLDGAIESEEFFNKWMKSE